MKLISNFGHNENSYKEYSEARDKLADLMTKQKVKDDIGDCFDEIQIVDGENCYNFFGKLKKEFEKLSELQSAILINEGFNWTGGNIFKNGNTIKGTIEFDYE